MEILAFDTDAFDWQRPAITEQHAFNKLMEANIYCPGVAYIAFPWATLFDNHVHCCSKLPTFARELTRIRKIAAQYSRKVTVCQHISMLKHQDVYSELGITDVFWSHKTRNTDFFAASDSITIHPFPLFPVSYKNAVGTERQYLYCFVGAHSLSVYISNIRHLIVKILGCDDRGLVIPRDNWHYQDYVYEGQVRQSSNIEGLIDNKATELFASSLRDSIFSLCPSGSGPNSIRLWESIAAGSIPVILSDTYDPPGNPALWEAAAVFCPETAEALEALPLRLEAMAADKDLMANKRRALKQLSALYGPDVFVSDIIKLVLQGGPERRASVLEMRTSRQTEDKNSSASEKRPPEIGRQIDRRSRASQVKAFRRAPIPVDGHVADRASAFAERGFLEPIRLFSASERSLLINHLTEGNQSESDTWPKGRALNDHLLFDMATRPRLLEIVKSLIGEDIILWGASTTRLEPGASHPWHADIECAKHEKCFVNVWLGLRNTSATSALSFIARSHKFDKTIQEVQYKQGFRRGEADDEAVLSWAREFDLSAEMVRPEVSDGDALIFNGRIWHKSLNCSQSGSRLALLLQYARADVPIFMPKQGEYEWPFKLITAKRPPVIVVSGSGDAEANRQVQPPSPGPKNLSQLATQICHFSAPLPDPESKGWQPHQMFRGSSDVHRLFNCHASVLAPGAIPHPPHSHIEEEILVVLEGNAELLLADGPDVEYAKAHRAGAGTFVYYPAYRYHTLRNAGPGPLTYLMFKWRGSPLETSNILDTKIVDTTARSVKPPKPWQMWMLFEQPTNFLRKLQCHFSEVAPGGGYEPHIDPYDVAIILLSGRIDTLGRTVEPFGVVYHAAGEPHGLRSVGSEPARYIVFEFHGASYSTQNLNEVPTTMERSSEKKLTSPYLHRNQGGEGLTLMEEALAISDQELRTCTEQLVSSAAKLAETQKTLCDTREKLATTREKLETSYQKLKTSREALVKYMNKVEEVQNTLTDTRKALVTSNQKLRVSREGLVATKKKLKDNAKKIEALRKQLSERWGEKARRPLSGACAIIRAALRRDKPPYQ